MNDLNGFQKLQEDILDALSNIPHVSRINCLLESQYAPSLSDEVDYKVNVSFTLKDLIEEKSIDVWWSSSNKEVIISNMPDDRAKRMGFKWSAPNAYTLENVDIYDFITKTLIKLFYYEFSKRKVKPVDMLRTTKYKPVTLDEALNILKSESTIRFIYYLVDSKYVLFNREKDPLLLLMTEKLFTNKICAIINGQKFDTLDKAIENVKMLFDTKSF